MAAEGGGLIELAREVGRLAGSQEEMAKKVNLLHGSHSELVASVRRLEESMRAVPQDEHVEHHAFVQARIQEARESAAFWAEMRLAAGRAVASKAGIVILVLFAAGLAMASGAKDVAAGLLHKALAALG